MALIDRQAAIDALERIFDRCEEIEAHLPDGDPDKTGYKMFPDYMTVWKYLRQMEMFDYMPVIRCEDCKYGEIDDPDFPNQYLCHYHGEDWNDGDHFCSHGVRRDKE